MFEGKEREESLWFLVCLVTGESLSGYRVVVGFGDSSPRALSVGQATFWAMERATLSTFGICHEADSRESRGAAGAGGHLADPVYKPPDSTPNLESFPYAIRFNATSKSMPLH